MTKQFLDALRNLGVKNGDILHISSDITAIDAFGQFSPFGYMHKNDAKMIFFDIAVQQGIIFLHYVEESLQVPYRYFKAFHAEYIDVQNNSSKRTYIMVMRDDFLNNGGKNMYLFENYELNWSKHRTHDDEI